MNAAYTGKSLALILGISKVAVYKRALREGWRCEDRPNPKGGGTIKEYIYSDLPEDVQLAIRIHEEERAAPRLPAAFGSGLPALRESGLPPAIANGTGADALNDKERERALAASRLIALYREHCRKHGWGNRVRAKEQFVDAYNLGERGSFPEIFRLVGKTSWKSLERQHLALRRSGNDPLVLADRRGKHRLGQVTITPRQDEILKVLAVSPNAPFVSEIVRSARNRMAAEGVACGLSDSTLRRRAERLRQIHYPEWVLYREGEKALNENCIPHIERDWDRVDVGDVVFADGHRLNFQIFNPWTGKPKRMTLIAWYDGKSNYPLGWEIMPEENTRAIASALYRAILNLGKIPKVLYLDNGKAFRGKFFAGTRNFSHEGFVGLFERLGMQVVYAWAYHPESKPIERWFGTLSEFERETPSLTGTSIANKPARLRRNEKMHRALHALVTGGRVPTIEETHRALAEWIDRYAARGQSGHLNGKCPREVFLAGRGPGFSEAESREIRLLMSEVPIKSIHRDGIKLPWAQSRYYHPALYGRQRQGAVVRYDWQDKSRIWVYGPDGKFICEAPLRPRVHPAAAQLGTPEDVEELQRQIALQRRLKKETIGPARKFFEAVVIPDVKRRREEEFGEGAAPAAQSPEKGLLRLIDRPMTEAEKEQALRDYEELAAIHEAERAKAPPAEAIEPEPEPVREPSVWEKRRAMNEPDRYEADVEDLARGALMPRVEKAWMKYFEETEYYERHRGYFEEYEVKMALMYQGDRK